MRGVFRTHFRDLLTRYPDLMVLEFRSYLADFPHLREAEVTSCEGLVTECEVRDALKQVGLNKSPGLDSLPYQVYLRMSHMFVPILTMYSTIGLPKEPFLVALPRVWSYYRSYSDFVDTQLKKEQ